jgi:hypothetical protein
MQISALLAKMQIRCNDENAIDMGGFFPLFFFGVCVFVILIQLF